MTRTGVESKPRTGNIIDLTSPFLQCTWNESFQPQRDRQILADTKSGNVADFSLRRGRRIAQPQQEQTLLRRELRNGALFSK